MLPSPPPTHRLLAVSVCALLGWSAWARGGTVVSLQAPLPWIGLAILVFLALDRFGIRSQRSEARGQRSEIGDQKSDAPTHALASSPSSLPPSAFDIRHSTFNIPPSASSLPPSTFDIRHSTFNIQHSPPSPPSLLSVLLFYAGFAFLLLLLIQWWNAGRCPYFHPFDRKWIFTPPPHPGWPWAVDRSDAAEMLRWFFPAWALMLALRYARQPDWLAKRVAWFLVVNAGLLAAFGIAQTLSGTQRIFWITPMSDHFFASFGYENHSASYFALLFALAAGMLLQRLSAGQRPEVRGQRSEVRDQKSEGGKQPATSSPDDPSGNLQNSTFDIQHSTFSVPPPGPLVPGPLVPGPLVPGPLVPGPLVPGPLVPGPLVPSHRRAPIAAASIGAVLCLAGIALSFSRTGLALTVGLSGAALLAAARAFWPRVSIAQRIAIAAGLIMGVATFFFVVASMGGVQLHFEAGALIHTNLDLELDTRQFMARSALQMWNDHPWFGIGGWGFRHFLRMYAAEDPGRQLSDGYANVHNDAMQALCEFGAVGFGLMLIATLAFAWPLLRRIRRHLTPGLALVGVGLLAVLFHSLIDLPFRSPAILYAWLAVCGLSSVTGHKSTRMLLALPGFAGSFLTRLRLRPKDM